MDKLILERNSRDPNTNDNVYEINLAASKIKRVRVYNFNISSLTHASNVNLLFKFDIKSVVSLFPFTVDSGVTYNISDGSQPGSVSV